MLSFFSQQLQLPKHRSFQIESECTIKRMTVEITIKNKYKLDLFGVLCLSVCVGMNMHAVTINDRVEIMF